MRDTTGSSPRIGVWMVGARGSVATAAIAGAAAIVAGAASPVGCVTETPRSVTHLCQALADLVFGGHDVVDTPCR